MTAAITTIVEKVLPAPSLILAGNAAEIRECGKHVVAEVVRIGRLLVQSKELLQTFDGPTWTQWLEREFKWSDQTAYRYIHLYELSLDARLHTCVESDLPLRTLYFLAAPKAEHARQEIADRIAAGEEVTREVVKKAIDRQKKAAKTTVIGATSDAAIANSFWQWRRARRERENALNSEAATFAHDGGDEPPLSDGRSHFLHRLWDEADPKGRAALIQRMSVEELFAAMSAEQRAGILILQTSASDTALEGVPS
jgi:hypothetical protein